MNILEQFKDIETFIFDVDGVLTESDLLITESGELLRRMSVRDGYALKCAIKAGYRICIITGGRSVGVTMRLKKLGINDVFSGAEDKVPVYQNYVELHNLDESKILYMGDDLPDYPVMRRVGLPTCPTDAEPDIIGIARYISPLRGGCGCVRDVIEKVMRLQGKWAI